MPPALPEDIVNDLKRDFARGFEGFREGRAMPLATLVLSKDTRDAKLQIHCYSSCFYSQNITRAEAQERIATAKEELLQLFSLFPELESEAHGLRPAFHFCYDTGKGAVLFATEEDGHFTYHDAQP